MFNDKPSDAVIHTRLALLHVRPLLQRIPLMILMVINMGMVGFVAYHGWRFIAQTPGTEKALDITAFVQSTFPALVQALKPQPLSIVAQGSMVRSLSDGSLRYDIWAKVANPNTRMRAEFQYQFQGNEFASAWQRAFVVPGEETYLASLHVKATAPAGDLQLALQGLQWRPVRPTDTALAALSLTDIKYQAPADPLAPFPQLSVSFRNQGIGNLVHLPLLVVLLRDQDVVELATVTLDNVLSRVVRTFTLTFPESLPSFTNVILVPMVNVYDPASFMESAERPPAF